MDDPTKALAWLLPACFAVGLSFLMGRLVGQHVEGALWFFTFSDYVNFAIPAVMVLVGGFVGMVIATIPQYLIAWLAKTFTGKDITPNLSTPTPSKPAPPDAPNPPDSQHPHRIDWIGLAYGVIGYGIMMLVPLLFVPHLTAIAWLVWCVFWVGIIFLTRLWSRSDALAENARDVAQFLLMGAWAILLSFFFALGFYSDRQDQFWYEVTATASPQPTVRNAPAETVYKVHDMLSLERGAILITSYDSFVFVPWSEVKRVNRVQPPNP